jgi:hypothetical protein
MTSKSYWMGEMNNKDATVTQRKHYIINLLQHMETNEKADIKLTR